ncbi:MAG: hypothetical protein DRQ88_13185 [Epsilonproteobacteria bacterium]|nr:MAG: hypothetical protein DRQ89_13700 [Campylobacterota bacterium]RLA62800.1 MAG: hypothetical protein DRQ88_13185 [Campylobacterota bacterium]
MDRARMYVGYLQYFVMIFLFMDVFKNTVFGKFFFSNLLITGPVFILLFVVGSLFIGYIDRKHIRGYEYKEITVTNPYFMEMRTDIKKLSKMIEEKKERAGLKITILSKIDYAGSGYKIMEAVSKHTDHDIDLFTNPHQNVFGHPLKNVITPENLGEVQQRIVDSDIVHIKGDWPAKDGYLGLDIMHKPTVQTVGGSFFRKKGLEEHSSSGRKNGGSGTFPMDAYMADLKTAFTLDLCYDDYSRIWTPHPIDSMGKPNIWKKKKVPVLLHMPSRRQTKDSNFIMDVLTEVKTHIECEIRLIEKVSFERSLKEKMECTIYFDQFKVGFYGNSAIEAMQHGIPTACWISPEAIERSEGKFDFCPIINAPKNRAIWVEKILQVLESDMSELSYRTKDWCNKWHSYEAIARQWDELYKTIL